MNVRLHHQLILIACCAVGLTAGRAEEAKPQPATPIIFSAPKSDTVSSNLNQLRSKSLPLTDLESGLNKPFDIFPGHSSDNFRAPLRQFTPPAPVLNSKKLKSLMEQAAEKKYLLPGDKDDDLGEDPDKAAEDPFSPEGRKRESRLDRYYDRLDRTRNAATNQTQNADWFGDERDPEDKNNSSLKTPSGLFDSSLSASARSLGQASNNIPDDLRATTTGGRLGVRAFGDIFGLSSRPSVQTDLSSPDKPTRLDDFKRLIDAPSYTTRNDFNATPPSSVGSPYDLPTSATSVRAPGWATTTPTAPNSAFEQTPGLAGAPGKPAALPDFAIGVPSAVPSLAPAFAPPPPRIEPPKPEFTIPRRRF